MPPISTALQHTCELHTPSALINDAFRYAKDNIARCMRFYSLGWGMSNAPHNYTLVVGRDTGWMCLGTDYVAPWFAPPALRVFFDRQKPNGQIVEYIDMETGFWDDYGLNAADNTSLCLWAVWRHWKQFADEAFRQEFLPFVRKAGDYLVGEIGANGLVTTIPAGIETRGITSWRNIIPNTVLAGEVTELNSQIAFALRLTAEFTGEPHYAEASARLSDAINAQLWTGERYLLNRFEGRANDQMTGDAVFPILCGVAPPERARLLLERLGQPDFWNARGLRTVPNTDPQYHPNAGYGLIGGSWPNLTLWYAAAVAAHDPDRAVEALERVARPVVEPQAADVNVNVTEFPEYFDGDTGINRGMLLSPWVAPTFLWAVLEGLLGLTWEAGKPSFAPHWPTGWQEIQLKALPCAEGKVDFTLRKGAES